MLSFVQLMFRIHVDIPTNNWILFTDKPRMAEGGRQHCEHDAGHVFSP